MLRFLILLVSTSCLVMSCQSNISDRTEIATDRSKAWLQARGVEISGESYPGLCLADRAAIMHPSIYWGRMQAELQLAASGISDFQLPDDDRNLWAETQRQMVEEAYRKGLIEGWLPEAAEEAAR